MQLGAKLQAGRVELASGPVRVLLSGFGGGRRLRQRYLDALKDPEWETKAVDWIVRGIDPDLPQPAQKQAR